jgi:hypothetical protein
MNQTSIEQSALAEPAVGIATYELQQPGLLLLNGDHTSHKLVALWRLDEFSKLYCQWVKE